MSSGMSHSATSRRTRISLRMLTLSAGYNFLPLRVLIDSTIHSVQALSSCPGSDHMRSVGLPQVHHEKERHEACCDQRLRKLRSGAEFQAFAPCMHEQVPRRFVWASPAQATEWQTVSGLRIMTVFHRLHRDCLGCPLIVCRLDLNILGTGMWQSSHWPKVPACGRGGALLSAKMQTCDYCLDRDYATRVLACARPVSGQAFLQNARGPASTARRSRPVV